MKRNIILAGVGGQGILSIAAIIGSAAMEKGLYIKQAEVHGMSQRGGDVHSDLRISSEPILSDLIACGTADLILSLEPMEALRYLRYLDKDGWVVTNSEPFVNIPNYPDKERIMAELATLPNVITMDIDAIAAENQLSRESNIILLGAAADIIGFTAEELERGINAIFGRKGEEVVKKNTLALSLGIEAAKIK